MSIIGKGFEKAKEIKTFQKIYKEIVDHTMGQTTSKKDHSDSGFKKSKHSIKTLAKAISAHFEPIANALPSNIGSSLEEDFCRGSYLKYFKTPLGSGSSDTRYSLQGMETIYLTNTEQTVIVERKETGLIKSPPHYHIWAEVNLRNVLDLTDNKTLQKIDIKPEEQIILDLEWEGLQDVCGVTPFTQHLGSRAFDLKYEAIKFKSVREPKSTNLVIFPHNLKEVSKIKVYDPQNQYSGIGIDLKNITVP